MVNAMKKMCLVLAHFLRCINNYDVYLPGVMKTGSAKLNFLCNFTQLPMCKISLFTVLFTADVSFFSCFLVRDLCRSACRHNCHPPPLPFALYPIGVKFGPGYTPLNFSSRGDSEREPTDQRSTTAV